MKKLIWLLLLAAIGAGVWVYRERGQAVEAPAAYRTAVAERGTIIAAVSTTGTAAPITTVIVGSQLSGQVVEILADFNSEVRTGQVLARLNSDQIRARLDASKADLDQARAARTILDAQLEKAKAEAARAAAMANDVSAQLVRAEAQLADAEKTLARQTDLSQQGIVSAATLQTARTQRDTLRAQRQSALAQIESAGAQMASFAADQKVIAAQMLSSDAQVAQRAAVVRQIEVDLANTTIRSPVDGVVVQRNVELGQPVAASLQAPTLFLVAQDLRRIQIQANVDEADVGRVREGQDVSFTVNAYPGRSFSGTVRQVRLGAQSVQNVVIYTTVIEVDNAGMALKPGMTANLRIITEQRANVVRVPNAALRWRPPASRTEPAQVAARPMEGTGDGSAAGPFAGGAQGGGGPGMFIERLKERLNLTAAQKETLDKIIADSPGIGRGGAGGGPPGGAGGSGGRGALMEKVRAILDDSQRAQLDEMAASGRGARARQTGTDHGTTGRLYQLGPTGEPTGVTVRLGASDGAFTEVISGLAPGAAVIIGGGPSQPRAATGFRFGL